MKKKDTFTFTITYFRPSGKYYTETTVNWEVAVLANNPELPYMHDAVAKLRGLQGGAGMPGLSSRIWDGPILIDCEEGYPCLILPDKGN